MPAGRRCVTGGQLGHRIGVDDGGDERAILVNKREGDLLDTFRRASIPNINFELVGARREFRAAPRLVRRHTGHSRRMGPGIGRDSGPRAPISKRVIIEDRKTDRDPMLPAFHVDSDLHDILHPADGTNAAVIGRTTSGPAGSCGQGKSGGPHQFHLRPADVLPARLADLGTFGKGWTTVWLACARRPADSTLGPLTPQGVRHVPFLAQLNTTYAIPSV
jgi:hypothetical protein